MWGWWGVVGGGGGGDGDVCVCVGGVDMWCMA